MSTKNKNSNSKCDYNNYKKVRYFHGQLLSDRDFTEEQIYLNEKRKLHNRMLHGWGVVCGLEIEAIPDNDEKIRIKKGLAIDCVGNEIFVDKEVDAKIADLIKQCEPAPVNTNPCIESSEESASTTWFVVLRYKDVLSDPVPVYAPGGGCEEKACDYSRVREGYCIELTQTCPNIQTIDTPCDDYLNDDEKKALLCEKLLYPCPNCCEEDGVVLGSIDVIKDTQIVEDSVNNWNCRKYVMTFGLLQHWMTKLGPKNVPFDAILEYTMLGGACENAESAKEAFDDICSEEEEEKKVTVPNVVKKTHKEAINVIKKAELTIGPLGRIVSGEEPDTVLSQSPVAGSEVYVHSPVNLFLAMKEGSFHSRPVTEIRGIGPAYAKKLANIGVKTVKDLSEAGWEEVAEVLGINEKNAKDFVLEAKKLIGM